ncbi:hypothetical protein HID58_075037 [Brassica napus]|uniref:Uncharacterized protein n=1 Tax=Brassica napus TaxID=3708 RepID=A0ABQ7YIK2_BRANA|nr:hypothetical protein HID58_075037 [Brassica napus]
MEVDEHGEPTEAAQTTAELQKQIDGLQGQITDMHRAWETTGENSGLSSEVQNLKEKLDKHSKQLEQSAEKLSQLQSENTVLRDQIKPSTRHATRSVVSIPEFGPWET